ncbi:dTDP-4-dehydrorhamnose 3,5-epimerase [Desulfovibrio inopinatus]|uniref:dTDP-4-dehydrorhamnose 3,5-epimerase n=1 Tax=Desulfovibrio inopinatus TaxID=102109 RepID=UPI00042114A5|nr:dTDP-4-dehydrorhamnose 3,5-epimerase [Desulfovibrio inopinatus]
MGFITTEFPGLIIYEPNVFGDNRGYFMESYNRKVFHENGIDIDFIQDNHARSQHKGVVRGLHFQLPPKAQTKLVRVTRGAVYDVVVDLRKGSPTYGKHYGIELSEDNKRQFLVPKGFAHGYVTLCDDVEFLYKVDEYYSKEHDCGILWSDPELGIQWPVENPVLSEKDKELIRFIDFDTPFVYS